MSIVRLLAICALAACTVPHKGASDDDDLVDTDAPGPEPETFLDQLPRAFHPTAAVELRFSSDHVDATFVCGIDGRPPEPCQSPHTVTVIDGPHLFSVAAVADGRRDQSAATTSWTTDTVKPHARFLDGPENIVAGAVAHFAFEADELATFTCRLDGGTPVLCESGYEVTVGEGSHSLTVIATDRAGHVDDAPSSWGWFTDFDAIAVDITSGPLGSVSSTSAEFRFTSNGAPGALYECRLDGEPFLQCVSPWGLGGLPEGAHVADFRVIGSTALTTRHWIVDTTPPVITIMGPQGPTASTDATFQLGSELTALISCRLDGGAPWSCGPLVQLSGLVQGSHSLAFTAVDAAGNSTQMPIVRTWIVDTVPPQSLLSQPLMTAPYTYAFTASSNESGGTFLCQFDGGDALPCPAQLSFTVEPGWHTLSARAVDAAGNHALDAAVVTWEVL